MDIYSRANFRTHVRKNREWTVRDQMHKLVSEICLPVRLFSQFANIYTFVRIKSRKWKNRERDPLLKFSAIGQQRFSSRLLCKFDDTTRSISLSCFIRSFLSRLRVIGACKLRAMNAVLYDTRMCDNSNIRISQ